MIRLVVMKSEEFVDEVSRLLHGLGSVEYQVCDEVVDQRMDEAESDPSVLISEDDFLAGIRRSS